MGKKTYIEGDKFVEVSDESRKARYICKCDEEDDPDGNVVLMKCALTNGKWAKPKEEGKQLKIGEMRHVERYMGYEDLLSEHIDLLL